MTSHQCRYGFPQSEELIYNLLQIWILSKQVLNLQCTVDMDSLKASNK